MRNREETKLQIQVSKYIKLQYPTVLFKQDLSGQLTNKKQAADNKKMRNGRGYPDIEILHPNKDYAGLYIELKTVTPFKKNGNLKKNEHLEEQSNMLVLLNQVGYKAIFCWSFDMAVEEIDKYMKIKTNKTKPFSLSRVKTYKTNK